MFNQWVRGWAPSLVTGEAYQRVIQSRFTYLWSRQDACNQATAVPLNHYMSTKTEAPALVVHHTCRMLTNQVVFFLTSTKSLLMKLQFETSILKYTLQPQAQLPCLLLQPPSLIPRSRRGSSTQLLHITARTGYHPTDWACLHTGTSCVGTAKARQYFMDVNYPCRLLPLHKDP